MPAFTRGACTCVRAYSSRVKRHSVLRGAGKSRGRLYANFYTADFMSRGGLVCPFVSLSRSPSSPRHFMVCISAIPVLCGYTIRLGRRVGSDAFLGLEMFYWRIWCSRYAQSMRFLRPRAFYDVIVNVSRFLLPRGRGIDCETRNFAVMKTSPLITSVKSDKNLSSGILW